MSYKFHVRSGGRQEKRLGSRFDLVLGIGFTYLIYKSNSVCLSVWCLSVWAVPGRFFQSLPVPYGASPDVTSPM
jgi:hypothetical protein